MSLLDLIEEGNIGLMRAVEKYDWRRGYTNSQLMLPGGSARLLQGPSQIKPELFVSQSIWLKPLIGFNRTQRKLMQELVVSPPQKRWLRVLGMDPAKATRNR
jgi:hypothetical protein